MKVAFPPKAHSPAARAKRSRIAAQMAAAATAVPLVVEDFMPATRSRRSTARPADDLPEYKSPKCEPSAPTPQLGHRVELLDLARIEPHPDNPRDEFEDSDPELIALAESMKELKLIQPISVVLAGDDRAAERFQIVCGERRWRAARIAGWTVIPGYVLRISTDDAIRLMVDENLQRKNLNPIETARAVELLHAQGMSYRQIAAKFGHSESWPTQVKLLLKLPEPWRSRVASGELQFRSGRALSSYADRPEVLAAVEADRKQNPADWKGTDDFDANLARIVESIDGLAAAETPEAPSGDETASLSPNSIAAGDAPAATLARRAAPVDHAAGAETSSPVGQATAGQVRPIAVPPRDASQAELLATIVEAVGQIADADALDEIADAVALRRAELASAAADAELQPSSQKKR